MFDYSNSSQSWRNSDVEFSDVNEIPFDYYCTSSLFDILSNVPIPNVDEKLKPSLSPYQPLWIGQIKQALVNTKELSFRDSLTRPRNCIMTRFRA
jgi:hypothetical protein